MNTPEEIVMSPLCRTLERDGHSLRVSIYQAPDEAWILEVIESDGTSHLYEELFETDSQAMDTLLQELDELGVEAFLSEAV